MTRALSNNEFVGAILVIARRNPGEYKIQGEYEPGEYKIRPYDGIN